MKCNMPSALDGMGVKDFAAFKVMCAGRQAMDHPPYECKECATGQAIASGKLTVLPENVRLIDLGPRQQPAGKPMPPKESVVAGAEASAALGVIHNNDRRKDDMPSDAATAWDALALRPIPATKLEGLTLPGLKDYWLRPVIPKGVIAPCPNCCRPKALAAGGVCCGCYAAGRHLRGKGLLIALKATALRLQLAEPLKQSAAVDVHEPPDGKRQTVLTGTDELQPADTVDKLDEEGQEGNVAAARQMAAANIAAAESAEPLLLSTMSTSPTRSTPFALLGLQIGELVDQKQAAYGDSFGKAGAIMRILYPNGISPEQMDDALAVVRIVDKLFRIATNRDALGESPFRDIGGYGLLGAARAEAARPQV